MPDAAALECSLPNPSTPSFALVAMKDSAAPAIDNILPRLFLGNADAARDPALLKSHGITHVVTAAVSDNVGKLFPAQFEYHEVCIDDNRDADLRPFLQPCADFIDAALADPCGTNRVFVHCMMGTSRSSSLVMFYMMQRRHYTLRNALLHIMHVRSSNPKAPYTHPNQGFMKQLIAIDTQLSEERGGKAVASLTLHAYMSREFSSGKNISRGPVPEPQLPRAARPATHTAAAASPAAHAVCAGGDDDGATAAALDDGQ